MNALQLLYPVTPVNVPPSVTNPSASFKKEVKKVLFSITLFFLVYVILIMLSVLLAIACVYAGGFMIIYSGHLIAMIAGLGIISIGVMVFIFLIKFIFSVKKHDESGTITLSESEQPQLFDFIRKLTADTQTPFPKKIVLSPEVNACVYYNDSFWSMIFPVKKNLQIGLALVNSLTLSEFKAVMAHEFGHFSQRSMKLGSFVYHVNKAIYNMLYENHDLGKFLEKWGSFHWAVSFFVLITIQLIKGIQKILQVMYGFINKNYMGLSREMEFHADAVAASVSGSNNCITSLRKLEISDVCYQNVIQKANEWLEDNIRMENVYRNHDEVMLKYAAHNKLPVENTTPVAGEDFFKKFQLHKVNIKNQWASHPPREERESHLQELNVDAVKDSRPAWVIFKDAESLQQRLTEFLYKTVPDYTEKSPLNAAAFRERYLGDIERYRLPEIYNGFYDDRQVNDMDVEAVCSKPPDSSVSFSSLFSDDWMEVIKSLSGNEYDALLLKAIVEKQIATRTFDYDGQKMDRAAAPVLLETLDREIGKQKEQLQGHDERIVSFFFHAAKKRNEEESRNLQEKYKAHFENRKKAEDFMNTGQRIMDLLAPLLAGQTVEISKAETMAQGLREESRTLKPFIKRCLDLGLYDKNKDLKEKAENFITADYHYFSAPAFMDNELGSLHRLVSETAPLISNFQYKQFKTILEYQLELYNRSN
ncbi:MAG TPA: M48 family metalloprotease [Ferruginibacter sp.]|nr:M48 family metalloprotease [Ferruginibacter sp.]